MARQPENVQALETEQYTTIKVTRALPFPPPAAHANEPRMSERIDRRFQSLAGERRPALVTYVMAGDPDAETGLAILKALPGAGADVIELGMPFTDPMADGPAVQAAGLRALKSGQTLRATLKMVAVFREENADTPIILMGYFNPIYSYGVEPFLRDAEAAGVDGLIVVDLPPEEDDELCLPALHAGLAFIRLATPTTDDARLPTVLANTSGFVVLCLDHRRHRLGDAGPGCRSPRPSSGSSGIRPCRSRSASASGTRRAPPPSARSPMASPSGRRLSRR